MIKIFLIKLFHKITDLYFITQKKTILKNEQNSLKELSNKGLDSDCSLSLWLVDSYMKNLIKKPFEK